MKGKKMSTIRKLQRSVTKSQHTAKDDDSGGNKSNGANKRHYNDNKSPVNYLKTIKVDNSKNKNKTTKRQKIG